MLNAWGIRQDLDSLARKQIKIWKNDEEAREKIRQGIRTKIVWSVGGLKNIPFIAGKLTDTDKPADIVVVDFEHASPGQENNLEEIVRSIRYFGALPIVRVKDVHDLGYIKQIIDSGTAGVLLPQVETKQQLEAAVSACIYKTTQTPWGKRAMGGPTIGNLYMATPDKPYELINDAFHIWFQVESQDAVNKLPEMLACAAGIRVDMVFAGPSDLSTSYCDAVGNPLTGKVSHPIVQNALDRIAQCAKKHDKALGTVVGAGIGSNWGQRVEDLDRRGFSHIILASDLSLLQKAAVEMAKEYNDAMTRIMAKAKAACP